MTGEPTIRAMHPDDWPAVRDIYEAGIATGHATFETSAPTWEHCTLVGLTDTPPSAAELTITRPQVTKCPPGPDIS